MMEQLDIQVPYSFIRKRTRLTWNEVKYGIMQGLFHPRDATEVALDAVERGADSELILELAASNPHESVLSLVERLAACETPQEVRAVQRKWTFLVLAWVFEHRNEYEDPLDIIEKIYADLDYPEQVAPFVRYMPEEGPDLGSKERNEQRLFQRWAAYLNAETLAHSTVGSA